MKRFIFILILLFASFFAYRYYQEQQINTAFDKIYAPLQ